MMNDEQSSDGPRVVILEDDELVGSALALMARDAGYEPALYTSLSQAVADIEIGAIHAIISDFDLGRGPNGVEAACTLRANKTPAPPVLIVTAFQRGSVDRAARAAGFEVSPKPTSPSFLRRWLARNAPPHRSQPKANRS